VRVRASFWAVLEASVAAALAWFVAHHVLGHQQPFFAPIAAAIAMSTNYFGRSKRAVQMVGGVLLGIGVAELLSALLGTSTIALGVTVMVTLLIALIVARGFVGEGMMFVNQAAASAILVVTLRRHGTGAERAVDALIGGAAALLVGVILFPSAPLPRLWAAERVVLESLAATLERLSQLLRRREAPTPEWTLAASFDIHDKLAELAQARARARANVRIAPRRWHLRPLVDAEDRRVARFDLLANAVLSLVRTTVAGLEDGQSLPAWLEDQVRALAGALRNLAQTSQPWPPELVREVGALARDALDEAPAAPVDRVPMVSAILRATVRDLAAVIEGDDADPQRGA
jgi:uncharacterized membrane protein YgaE (UPF0421/DUF939 family)